MSFISFFFFTNLQQFLKIIQTVLLKLTTINLHEAASENTSNV
jgi:hypothetical protein